MPDVLVAETERMRNVGWGKGEYSKLKLAGYLTLCVAFLRNNHISETNILHLSKFLCTSPWFDGVQPQPQAPHTLSVTQPKLSSRLTEQD